MSITYTDYSNYRVIQRRVGGSGNPGGNGADVQFAGTTDDAGAVKVQVRVERVVVDAAKCPYLDGSYVNAWGDVGYEGNIAAGAFSFSVANLPQGKYHRYKTHLRVVDAGNNVLSSFDGTNAWAVGICWAFWGQSLMVPTNWSNSDSTTYTAWNALLSKWVDTGSYAFAWEQGRPGWNASGFQAKTTIVPAMLNQFLAKLYAASHADSGVPIGVCGFAEGDSGVTNGTNILINRNGADPDDTATHYGRLLKHIQDVAPECITMFQIAADADRGVATATYEAGVATFLSNLNTDLGYTPICTISASCVRNNEDYAAGRSNIRIAHRNLDAAAGIWWLGHQYDFVPETDGLHIRGNQAQFIGTRMGTSLALAWRGENHLPPYVDKSNVRVIDAHTLRLPVIVAGNKSLASGGSPLAGLKVNRADTGADLTISGVMVSGSALLVSVDEALPLSRAVETVGYRWRFGYEAQPGILPATSAYDSDGLLLAMDPAWSVIPYFTGDSIVGSLNKTGIIVDMVAASWGNQSGNPVGNGTAAKISGNMPAAGSYVGAITNAGAGEGYVYEGNNSHVLFDSDNLHLNYGDVTQLNGASRFVFEFWAETSNTEVWQYLLRKVNVINTTELVIYTYTDGNCYIGIRSGGNTVGYFDTSAYVTNNVPFHMVVQYNGGGAANADRLKVWINDNPVTLTFTGTIPATTSATLSTKPFRLGDSTAGVSWQGKIYSFLYRDTADASPYRSADYALGKTLNCVGRNTGDVMSIQRILTVSSLSASSGRVGDKITVTGNGFLTSGLGATVNGTTATITAGYADGSAEITIPVGATTGNIVLTNADGQSDSEPFTVASTARRTRVSNRQGFGF